MNLLKQLLTVVAFGYLCYHIYTFGPGMFNVTVLVILVLANYFREKRESDLKANENARKARAEARHAKKHKKQ
jgi:F0F1-type ATP synthase epsilon subunit